MRRLVYAENTLLYRLAAEEVWLDFCDADPSAGETFGLWEHDQLAVVVGRASKIQQEVNTTETNRRGIPVLRRCTGGSTVVLGRGCLLYSLFLSYERRPELRSIDRAHALVTQTMHHGLASLASDVQIEGICDLTYAGKKFSGNALKCKRNFLLYHGTILYDFPLEEISNLTREPPRQPEYRRSKRHDEFVINLPVSGTEIRNALTNAWGATNQEAIPDPDQVQHLVTTRYSQESWNLRH